METSFQQLTTADIADVQDLAKQSKFLRESYSQDPNSVTWLSWELVWRCQASAHKAMIAKNHQFNIHTGQKVSMPVVKADVLPNKRSHCFNLNNWQSVLTNCTWLDCVARHVKNWPHHQKKLSSNASSCQALLLLVKLYLPGYSPIWGLSAHTAQCKPSQTAF